MKRFHLSFPAVLAVSALLVAAASARASRSGGAAASEPTWAIEGVMLEGCQCAVFCSCEFEEKPTFGHCDDTSLLDIEKGHFGDVRLDGWKVAVVSQSPHGERLIDTVGRLVFARIYVPDTASPREADALAEVARRVMGTFVGGAARVSPDEKVERVKMDVTRDGRHGRVRIPGVLDLELEALGGGDGKTPVVIRNNALTAFGFGDITVARSKTYRYTSGKTDWNYAGRSASIRPFKIEGKVAVSAGDLAAPAVPSAAAAAGPEHSWKGGSPGEQ